MSKERELLERWVSQFGNLRHDFNLLTETKELLAQPEPEPSVKLPESEDEAVMMNLLSDNWLRHHAPHRLNQPEQKPVAWMQDSIELYVLEEKSAIRGYVIPLYTAPPTREPLTPRQGLEEYKRGYARAELDLKREPLSDDEMRAIWKEGIRGEIPFVEIGRAIEKAHGIGGQNE